MELLGNILAGKQVDEPEEVRTIKRFVLEHFEVVPQVSIQQQQIVIAVKGAALAGALRPKLVELRKLCNTTKRSGG